MTTPTPTTWACPSAWPNGHDGEWRLRALIAVATGLSAKAPEFSVTLHTGLPPCLRLEVLRNEECVAVIFANRNALTKQNPIYTVYTGNREEYARCHSVLKLIHVTKHASGALPKNEDRLLLLPESLDYLQPLAEKDHPVSSGMNMDSFVADLLPSEVEDYACLYRIIVENQDLQRINQWLEANYPSATYAKVSNLLFALDGLAQARQIPEDIARTRMVEWDNREHDDEGNGR